ncbi:MBL fold metallo-hydrolase [Micromonospora sp. DR5-3]|uniref:MBL fold metallo-hydrolase n=1 Tax=unclassified Micromonospora TaxID=2617518 RepID=UPI0011D5292C|nr:MULTISPECIES: MBL fold metallo-hydrolase [unclassified Micromonospora]MCW3820199.1 MBL fold metallo-hydrolase [Micromonospora sp. DR5-3]TYC09651.1 MBL fold metallo-hydrolase [Micromonospora sp. MP36]
MPTIKSFAIGNGDMYYIRHGSDNFTIIDCSLPPERAGSILTEIATQSKGKGCLRFISTHPDQDHIGGLAELDDHISIRNFYCVKNEATKDDPTDDFKHYCSLRDDAEKAFYIYKGCTRRWMNQSNEERGSAGLNVLWPITSDPDFRSALADAAAGMSPNNISCILQYSVDDGPRMLWMGDLETDFMEKIESKVAIPKVDVLFAPHHGRTSGKVPRGWLEEMDPGLVVVGEAPSEYLDYYNGYNTITQNSCGDILFDTDTNKMHIYVGDHAYGVNFLHNEGRDHSHGLYYIGTLECRAR